MRNYDYFVLAKALHIVGVVLWIGGVAFVTTILIPSVRKIENAEDRLSLFETLEGRFAFQAKLSTLMVGLSGLYMLYFLKAWGWYLLPQLWWLHLMTFVWVVFTLILFLLEPLFLHDWFVAKAIKDSETSFRLLHLMHKALLTLSLFAVVAAMMGAHGFNY